MPGTASIPAARLAAILAAAAVAGGLVAGCGGSSGKSASHGAFSGGSASTTAHRQGPKATVKHPSKSKGRKSKSRAHGLRLHGGLPPVASARERTPKTRGECVKLARRLAGSSEIRVQLQDAGCGYLTK